MRIEEQKEVRRRFECFASLLRCLEPGKRRNTTAGILGWLITFFQHQYGYHLPPDRFNVDILIEQHVTVIRAGQKDVQSSTYFFLHGLEGLSTEYEAKGALDWQSE